MKGKEYQRKFGTQSKMKTNPIRIQLLIIAFEEAKSLTGTG
jgi:hypothetical protein